VILNNINQLINHLNQILLIMLVRLRSWLSVDIWARKRLCY